MPSVFYDGHDDRWKSNQIFVPDVSACNHTIDFVPAESAAFYLPVGQDGVLPNASLLDYGKTQGPPVPHVRLVHLMMTMLNMMPRKVHVKRLRAAACVLTDRKDEAAGIFYIFYVQPYKRKRVGPKDQMQSVSVDQDDIDDMQVIEEVDEAAAPDQSVPGEMDEEDQENAEEGQEEEEIVTIHTLLKESFAQYEKISKELAKSNRWKRAKISRGYDPEMFVPQNLTEKYKLMPVSGKDGMMRTIEQIMPRIYNDDYHALNFDPSHIFRFSTGVKSLFQYMRGHRSKFSKQSFEFAKTLKSMNADDYNTVTAGHLYTDPKPAGAIWILSSYSLTFPQCLNIILPSEFKPPASPDILADYFNTRYQLYTSENEEETEEKCKDDLESDDGMDYTAFDINNAPPELLYWLAYGAYFGHEEHPDAEKRAIQRLIPQTFMAMSGDIDDGEFVVDLFETYKRNKYHDCLESHVAIHEMMLRASRNPTVPLAYNAILYGMSENSALGQKMAIKLVKNSRAFQNTILSTMRASSGCKGGALEMTVVFVSLAAGIGGVARDHVAMCGPPGTGKNTALRVLRMFMDPRNITMGLPTPTLLTVWSSFSKGPFSVVILTETPDCIYKDKRAGNGSDIAINRDRNAITQACDADASSRVRCHIQKGKPMQLGDPSTDGGGRPLVTLVMASNELDANLIDPAVNDRVSAHHFYQEDIGDIQLVTANTTKSDEVLGLSNIVQHAKMLQMLEEMSYIPPVSSYLLKDSGMQASIFTQFINCMIKNGALIKLSERKRQAIKIEMKVQAAMRAVAIGLAGSADDDAFSEKETKMPLEMAIRRLLHAAEYYVITAEDMVWGLTMLKDVVFNDVVQHIFSVPYAALIDKAEDMIATDMSTGREDIVYTKSQVGYVPFDSSEFNTKKIPDLVAAVDRVCGRQYLPSQIRSEMQRMSKLSVPGKKGKPFVMDHTHNQSNPFVHVTLLKQSPTPLAKILMQVLTRISLETDSRSVKHYTEILPRYFKLKFVDLLRMICDLDDDKSSGAMSMTRKWLIDNTFLDIDVGILLKSLDLERNDIYNLKLFLKSMNVDVSKRMAGFTVECMAQLEHSSDSDAKAILKYAQESVITLHMPNSDAPGEDRDSFYAANFLSRKSTVTNYNIIDSKQSCYTTTFCEWQKNHNTVHKYDSSVKWEIDIETLCKWTTRYAPNDTVLTPDTLKKILRVFNALYKTNFCMAEYGVLCRLQDLRRIDVARHGALGQALAEYKCLTDEPVRLPIFYTDPMTDGKRWDTIFYDPREGKYVPNVDDNEYSFQEEMKHRLEEMSNWKTDSQ